MRRDVDRQVRVVDDDQARRVHEVHAADEAGEVAHLAGEVVACTAGAAARPRGRDGWSGSRRGGGAGCPRAWAGAPSPARPADGGPAGAARTGRGPAGRTTRAGTRAGSRRPEAHGRGAHAGGGYRVRAGGATFGSAWTVPGSAGSTTSGGVSASWRRTSRTWPVRSDRMSRSVATATASDAEQPVRRLARERLAAHRRVGPLGADGVDPDPLVGPLLGQALGHVRRARPCSRSTRRSRAGRA